FFRASQAARVAMNQMLMQLRRSDVIDVPISNPANRIAFVGDDKVDRSFVYAPDATGQKGTLTMLIDNGMSMPISAVLARDVKVSFSVDTVHPETGSGDYVDRVSIDMTVEVGKSVVHLAGSAAPRRVQTFN
ncbi:MAG TPA: hypothetical protein VHP11_01005, partial [Tepidisphaeraceae bacterium]|nr:hypothetical protein [Tepidisphaeraceae bacterium]